MSISEELSRLGELHQRGVISDDEFARAKTRVLAGLDTNRADAPAIAAINGLRRSREDAWVGGICGGIARTTGTAAWVWRLMFTLLVLCAGTGVLAYLLMWILVPLEQRAAGTVPHAFEAAT